MNKLAKIALTATLALAITITLFACEEKEKKQTPAETPPAEQPSGSTFTDSRDNKTYKTVKIGTQVWMAENLNYEAKGSKCYENQESNCQKYGRLYDWETAKTACPSGWHLPSEKEYETLFYDSGYNEEELTEKLKVISEPGYNSMDWWAATKTGDTGMDATMAIIFHIYGECGEECYHSASTSQKNTYTIRCIQN